MMTLLHLISAVALLVWGTHIVRTGVLRVYGARLRRWLGGRLNRPLAFAAGTGVTALVQSSNATALLASGFVADRLMPLATATREVLRMGDIVEGMLAAILEALRNERAGSARDLGDQDDELDELYTGIKLYLELIGDMKRLNSLFCAVAFSTVEEEDGDGPGLSTLSRRS